MVRSILGTSVIVLLLACPTERRLSARAEEGANKDRWVYVPKDLDDCFAQLRKILKPEQIEKMKRGTEKDMVGYHHGLGRWMRNEWGLWQGSRLATWFSDKGIRHPDDMSGIILDSFWRHLNSKPIELDRQIKRYQDYWKQARIEADQENARAKRAADTIRGMMMGVSLATASVPSVKIPNREGDGLRARCLARFGANVLIAARTGPVEDFLVPGYYLDLDQKKIHRIRIPEIEEQRYAVAVDGVAYFSGVTKGVPVLVAVRGKARTPITPPETKCAPQLGIDGGNLLAVYPNSIYSLQGTKWSEVYKGDIKLPKSGPPPRKLGDKVFFRDEGYHEDEKRLWWLELSKRPRLVPLDEDIGVVGPNGPRWENCTSYSVSCEGELWAVAGSRISGESLVKRSAGGKYEVAIVNNSLRFDGNLLGSARSRYELPVSAVATGMKGGLLLAGDRGIYTLRGKRLQQIVAFDEAYPGAFRGESPWDVLPGDILQLAGDRYLISGVFGGIYLIERMPPNAFTATRLDKTIGEPVTF